MERFSSIESRLAIVLFTTFVAFGVVAGTAGPASAQEGGAPSVGSSPSDDRYMVGSSDAVLLQVSGRPELSGLVTVDSEGRIQAPLLGAIAVAGRTPAQLTEELTERYQLIDPRVTEVLVSVAQYGSRTLNFIGAVGREGKIGFRELPDIWDALLAAGGAAPEAELGRVQIVRRDPGPNDPRSFRVDLSRGIDGTPASSLPELRPGDTIIVPQLEAATAAANGFRILGAVDTPGSYSISQASNLLDALAVAGGVVEAGDLGSVRLTRRSATGVMTYDIDVEAYLTSANPPMAFPLREGDTIFVPASEGAFARVAQYLAPLVSIASTIVIITQSN